MSRAKILIIEDDADIREGLKILLEGEGYEVDEAEDGCEGLKALTEEIDLVILDVIMPGMSGLKTCQEIRKISFVPILFLSAKAQESDKLIGLMAGGDDYLPKPFSYAELLGRVIALLRRYKLYKGKEDTGLKKERIIKHGGIQINRDFNEVFIKGKPVELSAIEYSILLLLMEHPKKIFSAQNIYESIWNEPYFYNCNSTVMVHIRRLRVKIEEDSQNPKYITTVWGKGYRFDAHES